MDLPNRMQAEQSDDPEDEVQRRTSDGERADTSVPLPRGEQLGAVVEEGGTSGLERSEGRRPVGPLRGRSPFHLSPQLGLRAIVSQ